jgi:hypothetical protein
MNPETKIGLGMLICMMLIGAWFLWPASPVSDPSTEEEESVQELSAPCYSLCKQPGRSLNSTR